MSNPWAQSYEDLRRPYLEEKKAKKDYDGDGKVESGSKEHAGVVHNAIQRAKGGKADGNDTRKEEVETVDEKFSMAAKPEKREAPRPTRKAENKKGMSMKSRAVKAVGTQRRQDKETGITEDLAGMVDKATKAGQGALEKIGVKINRTPRPTARPSAQTSNTVRQNSMSNEETLEEKKKGLWDNIHAKRKRGEKPAKKGDKDYPKTLNVEGVRDPDPKKGTEERKARLEKKRGMKLDDHPQYKKEAFLFSDEEVEQLHIIDECTDEELIDFMIEAIQELAVDQEDLVEICEALEGVEVLTERMDPKEVQRRRDQAKDRLATGAAMKKAAEKSSGPSRMDRLKSAAKKAGSMVKAGVKTAGKKAVQTAGKVAGEFSAAKEKQKKAAMARPEKKETSSSSSSDDDGTGGKLDKLLADTRGKSSSSSSSSSGGGGSSSSSSGSSSSGSTRRAVGGALRKVGGLLKKGLKKAVGKTSRLVSKGSDKLAKRLGEQYDEIADMYESGLFTIEEIENVVELYKGKHGQTAKQYADSRSQGGKMVSGDSKMSGAEYTHGRRVKAANPGMQPDVGGKTKPKSQGKMDRGTRADLEYRKANLRKKD